VQHIEDDSNQNNRYDRNWIRNVAWPLIQSRYHIADVNANRSINLLNEAWELTQDLAKIDLDTVSLGIQKGTQILDWTKLKKLSHLRLKNLILYVIDQHGVENFSTHHVEDFSTNLLRADSDSNTEMSLNGLILKKIGHKVQVIHQTQTIEG
jgi:tRNA(Ile)-lysidine synthase